MPVQNNDPQRREVYHAPQTRAAAPRQASPRQTPRQTARQAPRPAAPPRQAPRQSVRRLEKGPWYAVPPQAGQPAPPARTPEERRAAARRERERRRKRRRMQFWGAVAGIFILSGIITLLLPADPNAGVTANSGGSAAPAAPGVQGLVAPLPYGGSGTVSAAPAVEWGLVGPQPQSETYTFTAAPARDPTVLPESGRVELSWFDDAAFLGDSLSVGYIDYNIDVSDALICAYTGVGPSQIVNRSICSHPERGEEIPLDVLSAAQPAKLYILLGANALLTVEAQEGYLAYYGRMLDELRAALPNTVFYVQSVLPVTANSAAELPGLAPEPLRTVNAALKALCTEKGCYFLDLHAEFADENDALIAEYAQPDGLHLTVAGYRRWVAFLCSHTPYNKSNPYQPGSTWYLNASVRDLLKDIP